MFLCLSLQLCSGSDTDLTFFKNNVLTTSFWQAWSVIDAYRIKLANDDQFNVRARSHWANRQSFHWPFYEMSHDPFVDPFSFAFVQYEGNLIVLFGWGTHFRTRTWTTFPVVILWRTGEPITLVPGFQFRTGSPAQEVLLAASDAQYTLSITFESSYIIHPHGPRVGSTFPFTSTEGNEGLSALGNTGMGTR